MKRLIIALLILFFFGIPAYAQMGDMMGEQKGEMKQQDMMMDEGMMKPMKPMVGNCRQMMKQMMGDGMMMQNMMQIMMNMLDMQEKMIKSVKTSEKKQMMSNMAQMKEKMQKMMSMRMGMMGMDDSQSKIRCAERWLKKAIDLHELHMKDPKTTTDASQMEMMEQMKKAYGCITGTGFERRVTPPKRPAADEKKKDDHR